MSFVHQRVAADTARAAPIAAVFTVRAPLDTRARNAPSAPPIFIPTAPATAPRICAFRALVRLPIDRAAPSSRGRQCANATVAITSISIPVCQTKRAQRSRVQGMARVPSSAVTRRACAPAGTRWPTVRRASRAIIPTARADAPTTPASLIHACSPIEPRVRVAAVQPCVRAMRVITTTVSADAPTIPARPIHAWR